MKRILCEKWFDIEQQFEGMKKTNCFRLRNQEDDTGRIFVMNGTDKFLFWLNIGELQKKFKNIFYWISTNSNKDQLIGLVRFIPKNELKNHDEISGKSYNEVIEFAQNLDLLNKIAEESLKVPTNETKKKKKWNKTKIN